MLLATALCTLNTHPMYKILQVCWHRTQRKRSKSRGLHKVAMVALVCTKVPKYPTSLYLSCWRLVVEWFEGSRRSWKLNAGRHRCFDVLFCCLCWFLLSVSPFQRILGKVSCPFLMAISCNICRRLPAGLLGSTSFSHVVPALSCFPSYPKSPSCVSRRLPFCWFSTNNGVTTSYVPRRGVRGVNEFATQVLYMPEIIENHCSLHTWTVTWLACQLHSGKLMDHFLLESMSFCACAPGWKKDKSTR